MKKIYLLMFSLFFVTSVTIAQEQKEEKKTQQGHTDQNKFRQMKDVLATPNDQHTASGAPGHQYTQQQVDYVMDIRLDEANNKIYGDEKITYYNNSKDFLEYLWVQLDQNMRADDSQTPLAKSNGAAAFITPENFKSTFMKEGKGFGFNIEKVETDGKPLSHLINRTMMRINLPKALAPGDKFNFSIKWNYKINDINKDGGRSGLESFEDGNNNYTIAQFFPRLAVYNNVEGWQN
ncbi:MAG: M1 family peptidase, partial [Flavobacteriales bacterium]